MESLNKQDKGEGSNPFMGGIDKSKDQSFESEYEATSGFDSKAALNIGKALSKEDLEAALAETDEEEITNIKKDLGVPQKVTVRNKAEIMGQPISAQATPKGEAPAPETKTNNAEASLNALRTEIAGVKDFAELYQVLHEADKSLIAGKKMNADGLRTFIEESRSDTNFDGLQRVTRYLGVRSKAIELVKAETQRKIDHIAETRNALKAELGKSGAGNKVELNNKLNAELRGRDNLMMKVDYLNKMAALAGEVPLDTEPVSEASIPNVESDSLVPEMGKFKASLSNPSGLRPQAGMGGSSVKKSEAPEKEEKWSLWKELKHWGNIFRGKRS